ncbi:MAG: hypothetical protein IJ129_03545 [Ruminococcus sp.]|nr:hypothetical protein [Ruminococcus sp.]
MKNTSNSKAVNAKNVKKNSKAFTALVCATIASVVAAGTAMMAVIVTPADNNTQPAVSSVAVEAPKAEAPEAQQEIKVVEQTAPAAEQKQAPVVEKKSEPVVEQAAPVVEQAAPVVEQQAPVVQQQAPVVQQQAPVVQQQAPVVQQQAPATKQLTGTPVIPQGEVNDWKTHNAKDGFPIGSYIDGKSAQRVLNVVKLDDANYNITVTAPTSANTEEVYTIKAVANGSKMYYTNATKSTVTYDDNRNVIDNKVIENGHSGTFDASDAGYTWADSEGTSVFVPWIGY